ACCLKRESLIPGVTFCVEPRPLLLSGLWAAEAPCTKQPWNLHQQIGDETSFFPPAPNPGVTAPRVARRLERTCAPSGEGCVFAARADTRPLPPGREHDLYRRAVARRGGRAGACGISG